LHVSSTLAHSLMNPTLTAATLAPADAKWLSHQLTRDAASRKLVVACCSAVFLVALGTRILHWQDLHPKSAFGSLAQRYQRHAALIAAGGEGLLFPGSDRSNNGRMLSHPPGYAILVAAIYRIFGESDSAIWSVQVIGDSIACVLIMLIAAELLPLTAATIAGLLAAFCPQLGYYSIMLLPDSLATLPILAAFLVMRYAVRRSSVIAVVTAGALLGISCWLRPNALLLSPFLAALATPFVEKGKRVKFVFALLASTTAVIVPITIRNWIVFHRFIPLSLGAGLNLVEGLGDYDRQGRFGMPITDSDSCAKDVEWNNRPDYSKGLWQPDGYERDQVRIRRGLEVIKSNPTWFLSVMVRRAASMVRYNDSLALGWPRDTSIVPFILREPSFGHALSIPADSEPELVITARQLSSSGSALSKSAEISLASDGEIVGIQGDGSNFDDQFQSAPLSVSPYHDYLMRVSVASSKGNAGLKATTVDRRLAFDAAILSDPSPDTPTNDTGEVILSVATGDSGQIRFVVSNNGNSPSRPAVFIHHIELFNAGPTPTLWTRYLRPLVRGVQKNLFTTARMVSLIGIGVLLLVLARQRWTLFALLAVPLYYLCLQSAIHTEYRYILAIHYFLLAFAAVTLYVAGSAIGQGVRWLASKRRTTA
jgi:dolichyl-phosphate-mannose-protein mannosyltransferase